GGTSSAEIYEPVLQSWVPTGTLNTHRTYATATVLPSGEVLAAGGGVNSAEVYRTGPGPLVTFDPAAVRFPGHIVGSTSEARTLTVTDRGNRPLHVLGVT